MKNKRFLIIVSVIAIIVFSVTLLGSGESETPKEVNNNQNASNNEPNNSDSSNDKEGNENETKVFEIGDVVKMGDLNFAVNGIHLSDGSDFIKPDEGYKFLMLDISIKNTGEEFENISSLMMFKLVDDEGISYDISLADTKGQVDGKMAPGRRLRGEIAFEVPNNIEQFELEINPQIWNKGLIIVNIPISSAGQNYTGAFANDTTSGVEHFNINDTVEAGDLDFSVNGVRTSDGSSFSKPDEGNQFLIVEVTINNNGGESENISSMMMFKLVDNEGISYNQSIMADTKGSVDGELGAGRKMRGEIAYEVPKNISKFELEITPHLMQDELIVIDIPVE